MMPPGDLRVLVEAAFPGAIIEPDCRHGSWRINLLKPVDIDGTMIATISVDDAGRVCGHGVAITAATVITVGLGRLSSSELVERRLHSATAHALIAARRRLGL